MLVGANRKWFLRVEVFGVELAARPGNHSTISTDDRTETTSGRETRRPQRPYHVVAYKDRPARCITVVDVYANRINLITYIGWNIYIWSNWATMFISLDTEFNHIIQNYCAPCVRRFMKKRSAYEIDRHCCHLRGIRRRLVRRSDQTDVRDRTVFSSLSPSMVWNSIQL